jgi:predicted small integral membrane protein
MAIVKAFRQIAKGAVLFVVLFVSAWLRLAWDALCNKERP